MTQHTMLHTDDSLDAVECQDAFHQYLRSISHLPPLTDKEDTALMQRLAHMKRGELPRPDGEAIVQRLIEGSVRLVVFIANRYYTYLDALYGGYRASTLMDFIGIGNVTLIECAQRCLAKERTPEDFGAYAGSCIRYRIIHHHQQACFVSLSKGDRQDAFQKGELHRLYAPLSLDIASYEGKDDRPLSERIVIVEEDAQERGRGREKRERVEALLATLPERERRIVGMRYGLDPDDQHEHTYEEMAQRMNACAQTCRNLEQKSLQALAEGTTLRTSTDYYSASEACTILGISNTGLVERIQKGMVKRHYLLSTDQMAVYFKTEIDALAQEYQRIAQERQHLAQDYYTKEECAKLLGVAEDAIKKWGREGKITRHQARRENYGHLYSKEEINCLVVAREEAAHLYYCAEEAAQHIGISRATLSRWVRKGLLKRYTHPGLSREGYAKDEVNRLAHLREQCSYDFYQLEATILQHVCA